MEETNTKPDANYWLVAIDTKYREIIKIMAIKEKKTIKEFLDEMIAKYLQKREA